MDEPYPSDDADSVVDRPRQFGVKHLLLATAWIAALLALAVSLADPGPSAVVSLLVFAAISIAAVTWLRWNGKHVLILAVAGLALVVLAISRLPGPAREAARRSQCHDNLKRIGLALDMYHKVYGSYPPAYVADSTGRPMHSWRVLILPYLGSREATLLYAQYDFSQPWDGPRNRTLHNNVLDVFCCPSDVHDGAATSTSYLAVVGPQTAWPGATTTKRADMTDGLSNTILVVETTDSGIHWMEPRDLNVTQMSPGINAETGQGVSSRHPGGVVVLYADGSTRLLTDVSTDASLLRRLLTPSGGESIDGSQ